MTETPTSPPRACDRPSHVMRSAWRFHPRLVAVVCLLAALAVVSPALAQPLTPSTLLQRPLPGSAVPGQEQAQLPLQAPITLTPSIGVAEEYNDNVFMDNNRR